MKEKWLSKIKTSEREEWLKETWAPINALDQFKRELILNSAQRLGKISDAAAMAFLKSTPAVLNLIGLEDFRLWIELGAQVAEFGWGYSDAAELFYSISPGLLRARGFSDLARTVELGKPVWNRDRTAAAEFFNAIGRLLGGDPLERTAFLSGIEKISASGSRSAPIVQTFFRKGLGLLDKIGPRGFDVLSLNMELILNRNPDMAPGLLDAVEKFALETEPESWIAMESGLGIVLKQNWPRAVDLLHKALKVLSDLNPRSRRRIFEAFSVICEIQSSRMVLNFWDAPAVPFLKLGQDERDRMVFLLKKIAAAAPESAVDFYRNAPSVLEQIGAELAEVWAMDGLGVMAKNPEAGMAYFRLESMNARDRLLRLRRGAAFNEIHNSMRLYAEAVSSQSVVLIPFSQFQNQSQGGFRKNVVLLPDVVDEYDDQETNSLVYKLSTLHQSGHIEFGTYTLFDNDKRERLTELCRQTGLGSILRNGANGPSGVGELFSGLKRPDLAAALFFLAEDFRVDENIRRSYPGVKKQIHLLASKTLLNWPEGYNPSPVELVLRGIAVFAARGTPGNDCAWNTARIIVQNWDVLREPGSDVIDSLACAIASYELIMQRAAEFEGGLGTIMEASDYSLAQADSSALFLPEPMDSEGDDLIEPYESQMDTDGTPKIPQDPLFQQGDFRRHPTEFGFRVHQDIQDLKLTRTERKSKAGIPVPPQTMEQLADSGIPLEVGKLDGKEVARSVGLYLMEGKFLREEDQTKYSLAETKSYKGYLEQRREEEPFASPLIRSEPYYYDEWDADIGDYKINWCTLREELPRGGGAGFYQDIVDRYGALIRHLRRQFQKLKPSDFQWLKAMPEGERIDPDAVVRAVGDMRAGTAPDQRVYSRRDKRRRDVAAGFIIDMSASTDEIVLAAKKKIIDIEKEAGILLMEALESVGDDYGIFGFSGYGREDVQVFPIKEFDEKFGEKVVKRLDAAQPRRSTRMGAPIRHVTEKLQARDARIKLLMLISDGRPEDLSYGKDDTSRGYGLADTRMALYEARNIGIHAFGLTIDSGQRDYLGSMFGDIPYIIVDDVRKLPRRLPVIYGNITA